MRPCINPHIKFTSITSCRIILTNPSDGVHHHLFGAGITHFTFPARCNCIHSMFYECHCCTLASTLCVSLTKKICFGKLWHWGFQETGFLTSIVVYCTPQLTCKPNTQALSSNHFESLNDIPNSQNVLSHIFIDNAVSTGWHHTLNEFILWYHTTDNWSHYE